MPLLPRPAAGRRTLRGAVLAALTVASLAACTPTTTTAPPATTPPTTTQPPLSGGSLFVANTPPTLVSGTRQTAVLTLKHQLGILMKNDALINHTDNYYDPLTAGAVMNYQSLTGLPRTGIVDPATWRMIFLGLSNNLGGSSGQAKGDAPRVTGMWSEGSLGTKTWNLRFACPPGSDWRIAAIDDTIVGSPEQRVVCQNGSAIVNLGNRGIFGNHTFEVLAVRGDGPATSLLTQATHRTFITVDF